MNIRVMDIADYDRVSLQGYTIAGNYPLEVYTPRQRTLQILSVISGFP